MSASNPGSNITNILSFDVEDWYQGIEQPRDTWGRFEPRIERSLDLTLAILADRSVRATFFVLGDLAERHPDAILRVAQAGHEIATHGYEHEKIYEMTPDEFRDDLRRSIDVLEQLTGRPVRGHRAAYFSITSESLWSLPILLEEGIRYDASIYPGGNYRYGIPGMRNDIHRLANGLVECPVSTFKLMGRTVGLGGAYLRILPARLTAAGIRSINAAGRPAILYLHPWEFDPDHPRVRFRRRAMLTHYHNLRSTEPKLRRLLSEFRFAAFEDVLDLEEDLIATTAATAMPPPGAPSSRTSRAEQNDDPPR